MAPGSLRYRLRKTVGRLRAMTATFQFPLLDLPNELVSCVLAQLDCWESLKHVACTCRRLQELAEREIYRAVLIRGADDALHLRKCLDAQPRRAGSIRSLNVPCDAKQRQDWEEFCMVLSRLEHLERLAFEGPNCNTSLFEDEAAWLKMREGIFGPLSLASRPQLGPTQETPFHSLRQREFLHSFTHRSLFRSANTVPGSLQYLMQTVTLHLNGIRSPYWSIDKTTSAILVMPRLENLTFSCANINPDLEHHTLPGHHSSTTLKHLTLIECNISHAGLRALLALPKALKSLYLGENNDNAHHFDHIHIPFRYNGLFEKDAASVMNALRQQKDSLEVLTYAVAFYGEDGLPDSGQPADVVDGGFADFKSLHTVTLIRPCALFERALMTSSPPPSLQTLSYKSNFPFDKDSTDEYSFVGAENTIPFLRAPSSVLPPTLRVVKVTFNADWVTAHLLEDDCRAFIEAAAKECRAVDVDLQVWYTEPDHFFAPFLYGESEPEEILAYNPQTARWHGEFAQRRLRPGSRAVQDPNVLTVI